MFCNLFNRPGFDADETPVILVQHEEEWGWVKWKRWGLPISRSQTKRRWKPTNQPDSALVMEKTENLCLRWDDFQANASSTFVQMRGETDFTDVTLVCEDGTRVESHKLILSSCSPIFSDLLKTNPHPHPMLFMRGIKSDFLMAMVDFVYCGEASIALDDLEAFLAVADELRLKGLKDRKAESGAQKDGSLQNGASETPIENPSLTKICETGESPKTKLNNFDHVLKQLDKRIQSMIKSVPRKPPTKKGESGRIHICKVCGKEGSASHLIEHVEANHITGVFHPCNSCGKSFKARYTLSQHVSRIHPGSVNWGFPGFHVFKLSRQSHSTHCAPK